LFHKTFALPRHPFPTRATAGRSILFLGFFEFLLPFAGWWYDKRFNYVCKRRFLSFLFLLLSDPYHPIDVRVLWWWFVFVVGILVGIGLFVGIFGRFLCFLCLLVLLVLFGCCRCRLHWNPLFPRPPHPHLLRRPFLLLVLLRGSGFLFQHVVRVRKVLLVALLRRRCQSPSHLSFFLWWLQLFLLFLSWLW
jgi:hypothetical protein